VNLFGQGYGESQKKKTKKQATSTTHATAGRTLQFCKMLSPALVFGGREQGASSRGIFNVADIFTRLVHRKGT